VANFKIISLRYFKAQRQIQSFRNFKILNSTSKNWREALYARLRKFQPCNSAFAQSMRRRKRIRLRNSNLKSCCVPIIYAFSTHLLMTNLPLYFSALLALKSMQDPCKFTLNSAAYRPINLKFYRRFKFACVLNLDAFICSRILSRSRCILYRPQLGALF